MQQYSAQSYLGVPFRVAVFGMVFSLHPTSDFYKYADGAHMYVVLVPHEIDYKCS